jgi:WD40 repeat protein
LNNGNIVTISLDNIIKIFNSNKELFTFKKDIKYNISYVTTWNDCLVLGLYNYKDGTNSVEIYHNNELRYSTGYYGIINNLTSVGNKILIGSAHGINNRQNIIRLWDVTSSEEKMCKKVGSDNMKIVLKNRCPILSMGNYFAIACTDGFVKFFDSSKDVDEPTLEIRRKGHYIYHTEIPNCPILLEDDILLYGSIGKPSLSWYDMKNNIFLDEKIINCNVKCIKLLNKNRCAVVVTDYLDRDTIQIWNIFTRYMIFAFAEINKGKGESITLGGLTMDERLVFVCSGEILAIGNLDTWSYDHILTIPKLNCNNAPVVTNSGEIVATLVTGELWILS